MQFAEGDVESPAVLAQVAEAVEGQVDALSDADSCAPGEQESVRRQVIGSA